MKSRRRNNHAGKAETVLAYSTAGPIGKPMAAPRVLDPTRSQVRLRLDRRASDRVVTVVSGIEGGRGAIASLAAELKAVCNAGGTAKGGVIEIQGDHRDAVEAALTRRGFRSKRSGG